MEVLTIRRFKVLLYLASAMVIPSTSVAQNAFSAQAGPYRSFQPTWSANHVGTLRQLTHWTPQGMVATPAVVRRAPPRAFPNNASWYPKGQGLPPRFAPAGGSTFGPWTSTYQLSSPPPELGFRGQTLDGKGIVVDEVTPGGLAERMGLKAGDMIVRINGRTIRRGSDLYAAIRDSSGPARVIVRDQKSGRYQQLNTNEFPGRSTEDAKDSEPSGSAKSPTETTTPTEKKSTPADKTAPGAKKSNSTEKKTPTEKKQLRPRPLIQSTSADPNPLPGKPPADKAAQPTR